MYRILQIPPENEIQLEGMGSKIKSWHLIPEGNESQWLFKRPQRENSGEHWAEKIVAEVAALLSVPHARVELAEYQGSRGSITESIVPENYDLVHGNEVLESTDFPNAFEDLNFHLSDHTLENIWLTLDKIFESETARIEARCRLAEYLVLDAVVGNTDRHSENWGILQRQDVSRRVESLAPSYDHGSSLGRELMEERRERFLADNRVGDYAERGRGQIYWRSSERRGPSPLELIRLAIPQYHEPFRAAIAKLGNLDDPSLRGIVDSVPDDWMTPSARTFAFEFMRYSCAQLREAI